MHRSPARTAAWIFIAAIVVANCAGGSSCGGPSCGGSSAGCSSGGCSSGGCAGAGCGGSGCTLEPIPGGFPRAEELPGAIQLRVTKPGLTFLENNIDPLITAALPTGLDFDVPPTCDQNLVVGNVHICGAKQNGQCVASTPPCKISAAITGVKLEPNGTSNDRVKVTARLSALTPQGQPLRISGLINCSIELNTANAGAADAAFSMDLRLQVDATTKRTNISVENATLDDLDSGDIKISGGFPCGLIDLPFIKGFIINTVKNQVSGQVQGMIGDQLCASCATGPCPSGATCDPQSKLCMLGANCLQALGMEGRTPLTAVPGAEGGLDIIGWLGGLVQMPAGGVTLGMIGGAAPASTSTCVKPRPELKPDTSAPIAVAKLLQGDVDPDGQLYDLGFAVHQRVLDQAAWSLYTTGGLCVQAGSELSDLLSTSTFSLIMPSINALTGGRVAAMKLALQPSEPPTITIGKGVLVDDGKGNMTIQEPLLNIKLKDLRIQMYALIEQRFVRLVELTTDVELPLALQAVNGELVPVIGSLDNALTNLRVSGSQLLAETPASLEAKFPIVLKLALGMLPDLVNQTIPLPAVFGLEIKDPKLTGIENNTMLGVFARLGKATTKTSANHPLPPAETTAELLEVIMPKDPETLRLRSRADLAHGPQLRVRVGAFDDADLEYSWRLDGTSWSPFVRGPELRVRSSLLFLLGKHTLDIRARRTGRPNTTDPTPRRLSVTIENPFAGPTPLGETQAPAAGCAIGGDVDARAAGFGFGLALLALVGLRRRRRRHASLRHASMLGLGLLLALMVGCSDSPPAAGDAGGEGGLCGQCQSGSYCCQKTGQCETVQYNCTNITSCPSGEMLEYGAGPFMDVQTCEPLPLADCSCKPGDALKPGIAGRHAALAASGTMLLASAYEQTFGDLILVSAKISDPSQITVEAIDGVPASTPTHDPTGYRKGISDKGDDVGQGTDIAVDEAGNPLISFHDVTNKALRFTQRASEALGWTAHAVATPTGTAEIVGRYTAITRVGGNPAIAFSVQNIAQTGGTFTSELRFALASSPTPKAASDWTISTIASSPSPCRNLCGTDESCFVTTTGSQCKKKGTGCATCATGTACLSGTCQPVLADSKLEDVPEALIWPEARVTTAGGVLVVYHDVTAGTLEGALLASPTATTWTKKTLRATAGESVGAFPSAVVDAGDVHIAYQNWTRGTLHYVRIDGASLAVKGTSVIDDGLRPDGRHPVGADASLALDASNQVRVIYQDQQTADVLAATRAASGGWTPNTATDANLGRLLKGGDEGFGFYLDLVSAGGSLYGCSFVYTAGGKPPGALAFFAVP